MLAAGVGVVWNTSGVGRAEGSNPHSRRPRSAGQSNKNLCDADPSGPAGPPTLTPASHRLLIVRRQNATRQPNLLLSGTNNIKA